MGRLRDFAGESGGWHPGGWQYPSGYETQMGQAAPPPPEGYQFPQSPDAVPPGGPQQIGASAEDVPTSIQEILKRLISIDSHMANMEVAYTKHYEEEEQRRNAWFHARSFRIASPGTVFEIPEVSGNDVRWLAIDTATTGGVGAGFAAGTPALVYVKFGYELSGTPNALPYDSDYDFVTSAGGKIAPVPCRNAQAVSVFSTAPIDGVIYLGGSKDVLPS